MNEVKLIRHIALLSGMLAIALVGRAQYINVVCTGTEGIVYRVEVLNAGSTFEWSVEGGSIVADYGDSIAVDWGMEPGVYRVQVQETSIHGCVSPPVSGNVLVSGPVVELGPDIEICEGEVAEIEPSGDFAAYRWHDGTNSGIYYGANGEVVTVEAIDAYGCIQFDSLELIVHPNPVVDLGPDTVLCGQETLVLDAGNVGANYTWFTGETFQTITVSSGEQEIWVMVENEFGCTARDTIRIRECDDKEIFKDIPTAFTPNGDGKNDYWRFDESVNYPAMVVEIFDRWGNLVYRSEPGYPHPWDGRSMTGKALPMDSYFWVIDLNDGSEPLTGNVTIIR